MQISKPVVLFDIDYTLFDTAFFKESRLVKHKAYEEVIGVLDNLNKIAVLGIFSEGDIEFQIEKLTKTDIKKYFDEIHTHIVSDKVSEIKKVFNKYAKNKIFLVDDKLSILRDLRDFMPSVFTIWVKRGPFAQNQREISGFKPDAEVKILSEVVKIVQMSS